MVPGLAPATIPAMDSLHRADLPKRAELTAALERELGQQPRVVFAYLHGSFLTEPAFHDIDVAVYLDAPREALTALCVDLAERLSRVAGLPFDVRPLNEAPVPFRFHAMRGRVLLSRDDERLADLLERTIREYLDIEPLLRRATIEAFAR